MSKQIANRVIRACAGSGKTYALIERLCELLSAGAAPGEILAITFTHKAAEEITTRLLSALEQRAAAGEEWAARCRRRILLAETAADELNIHTFHRWFGLLLAGQCWSKGWYGPPALVEDDGSLRRQAWLRWLRKPPAEEALNAVLATFSPAALEKLLTEQVAKNHLNAYRLLPDKTLAPPDTAAAAAELVPALEPFIAAFADVAGKVVASAVTTAGESLPALETAAQTEVGLSAEVADTLHRAFFTQKGSIRPELTKAAEKNNAEALLGNTAAAVKKYNDRCADYRARQLHNNLLILTREYLEQLAKVKNEHHQMSFDDLEYESYQAVKACGDVNNLLYRVNEHYRHILIDEFQDTSPLQWHIIRCWLAAACGSEQAPSVFIVGDVKQAIYRFRHGDARLLAAAADYLTKHYQAVIEETNCCYRLAPPLLSLVNEVFADLLPDFSTHTLASQNQALPGRVEWHELPAARKNSHPAHPRNPLLQAAAGDTRRQRWADNIADKVDSIIGRWQVRADTETRPVCAEDILILLPQFTYVKLLRQALLRSGLACAVRREGVSFTESLACRDMIALLSVLQAPEDNSLSLAQVLKSPLFAWSEKDLAAITGDFADSDRKTLWRRLLADTRPSALAAAATLKRWRGWAQRGQLPVHDLLQRIFKDGQVVARYRAAVAPSCRRQVSEELAALLDFSLINEGGRQPLLRQFLATLPQAAADGGGSDGVRLMTVHGAKGLEAPVVILADCGFDKKHSGGDKDSVRLLLQWEPSDSVPQEFIFLLSSKKQAFSELVEQEAQRDEQERNNLFYVALTRARQGLIIFSYAADANPRLESLRSAMQEIGKEDNTSAYADSTCWVCGDPLLAGVSSAVPPPHPPLSAHPPRAEGKVIPPAVIRAGVRGSLLHQQLALLLCGYTAGQINQALAAADLLPQAQKLLQTEPLPMLLRAAQRIAVETEFIHADRLLRIDLLIFTADTIWIVDYKTGEADLSVYQEQMARYIAGVAAVYADKPIKAAFLTPHGFYEYNA